MERRVADELLEIAAQQQNLEQARTIQVCQALVAKADQQGSVRTLLQQAADGLDFRCLQSSASHHGLERVQPLIAAEEKMIEAELPRSQGNHCRFCATARLAAFLIFQHVHDSLTRRPFRITFQTDF